MEEFVNEDSNFRNLLEKENYHPENVIQNIIDEEKLSVRKLYTDYKKIYDSFDTWVLVKENDTGTDIGSIIVKKKKNVWRHVNVIKTIHVRGIDRKWHICHFLLFNIP